MLLVRQAGAVATQGTVDSLTLRLAKQAHSHLGAFPQRERDQEELRA